MSRLECRSLGGIALVVCGLLVADVSGAQQTTPAAPARAVSPAAAKVEAPAALPSDTTACRADRSICDFFHVYLDAFNRRDLAAFRATFADDITVLFDRPLSPERRDGRAAVETIFQRGFAYYAATSTTPARPLPPPLVPQDLLIQAFGDVAVISFLVPTPSEVARRTVVIHRGPTGWKVVHIHASSGDIPDR